MHFAKNIIQDEKIAVIFIGIQASGKTTFYEKEFKKLVHINLDELHTRNKENQLLRECMEKGISFVADNTNPTKADREKYILEAKEHGYKIKGYYFRSSIRESVERNLWSVDSVLSMVIRKAMKFPSFSIRVTILSDVKCEKSILH